MPELPEVETIRRYLQPVLAGRRIVRVQVRLDKCIKRPTVTQFCVQLRQQVIAAVRRQAKYLVFCLSDYYLLSHLRMEGKYFLVPPDSPLCRAPHTLVIFHLDNQQRLLYHDTRRFGTFHLIPATTAYQQLLPHVGYEPADVRMTPTYLHTKWAHKRICVKSALLEQRFIAGIGNIYANEVLFASHISPFTPVQQLTIAQLTAIITHTRLILQRAIQHGGTTIFSFQSQPGVDGRFTPYLQVHGRVNQPCMVCHTHIVKRQVGGRGTYFCPRCQR